MAKVDEDLDLDVESKKKSGGGNMKNIIIFSLLGLLLVGLSITTTLLILGGNKGSAPAATDEPVAEQHAEEKAADHGSEKGDATHAAYLNLDPAFVVNLDTKDSDIRYLQVSVSVQVNNESDLEIVKKHMPVIRHHLVLLFSSLDFNDIRSAEGKNKLTDEALKVIRAALTKAAGKPVVEAVYFPSIVGQ